MFVFNFAPRGYAICDGQLLPIIKIKHCFHYWAQPMAVMGRYNFALPNLRGRVPLHAGNGPGVGSFSLGQKGGSTQNTLQVANLPSHSHIINANNETVGRGVLLPATNNFPAQNGDGSGNYASTTDTTMNTGVVSNTGGNQAVNNMQPYLAIYFVIALQGIYPSRS